MIVRYSHHLLLSYKNAAAWRQPKPAEEPQEALCTFKRQLVDFEDFKDSLQLLIISTDFF